MGMAERLTEHDLALLRTMADEYDALLARWKEASSYSQVIANLDASFRARERTIGQAVEGGLFRRILNTVADSVASCEGGKNG